LPYLGDVLEGIAYKAGGEYMPQGTPLDSIKNTLPAASRIFSGDWDEWDKDAETMLTGASFFSGEVSALASASHILRDAWGMLDNFFGSEEDD
jgi:hypothetical protein